MAIALYYPWMHFQDDNWLKLALLTWDRIGRVRPKTLEDRDRELVRRLRAETDFIMDELTPSQFELMTVAKTLAEILETHEDRVVERYRVTGRHASGAQDRYTPPESQLDVVPASNIYMPDPTLLWVYCGETLLKMEYELRDMLVSLDLAVTEPGGEWVGVHPKLGSIYLAALADAMARNERLSPATDDPRMHNAVGALDRLTELLIDERARTPAVENAETAYIHVALRAVIEPDRLAEVPVAKLIKFRNGHKAELAAFRKHVAALATELQAIAEVESLDVAQAHLESLYQAETKPQLDELRRALRGLGIESTAGAMGLKVDLTAAAGTLIGGVAAVGGQLVVAGAAVALTVVPYIAGRFKTRGEQVRKSQVAYLLAADRKLAGQSLLGALR